MVNDLFCLCINGDYNFTFKYGEDDPESGIWVFSIWVHFIQILFKIPMFLVEMKILADFDKIILEHQPDILDGIIDFDIPW